MSFLVGLPFVSILLFVLAGFLLGHLVWHKDRSGDVKRIQELEEKYAAANGAAETHKQEALETVRLLESKQSQLEDATVTIQTQLDEEVARNQSLAEQLKDALSAQRSAESLQSQNEGVIREAGDELGRQTALISELQNQSRDQESIIESLKSQLAGDGVAVADPQELENLHSQVESQAKANQELHAKLNEISQQFVHANDEKNALAATLAEKESKIVELESQIGSSPNASNFDQIVHERELALAENEDMQATISEQAKHINTLIQERSDLQQQFADATAKSAEQSQAAEQLDQSVDEIVRLQSVIAEKDEAIALFQTKQQHFEKMKQELDNAARVVKTANQESTRVVAQLDESHAEIENLRRQLTDVNEVRAELENAREYVTQQEAAVAELRSYNEKQAAEIARLNHDFKRVDLLKKQIEQREADLIEAKQQSELQTKAFADQRSQLQELKNASKELSEIREQLDVSTRQVDELTEQRDQLAANQSSLEKQIEKLSTQVAMQTNDSNDLRRQLDTKSRAYDEIVDQNKSFASDIQKQKQILDRLDGELQIAKDLQPENRRLQDKVAELSTAIKDLSSEHEDSLAANAKATAMIRQLQDELHESAETIRQLRRPRGSVLQFGQDEQGRKAA